MAELPEQIQKTVMMGRGIGFGGTSAITECADAWSGIGRLSVKRKMRIIELQERELDGQQSAVRTPLALQIKEISPRFISNSEGIEL